MAVNPEWGRRLRKAHRAWKDKHDAPMSFRELGERVAALLGREKPYTHAAVRAWLMDGQEPDSFTVAEAIARVLEADPASLAFTVSNDESDEEIAARLGAQFRASRQVSELKGAKKPTTKKAVGGRKRRDD